MNGILLNQVPDISGDVIIDKLGYIPAKEDELQDTIKTIKNAKGVPLTKTDNSVTLSPESVGLRSENNMFSNTKLTGAPTAPTANLTSSNTKQIANIEFVSNKINSNLDPIINYLFQENPKGLVKIDQIPVFSTTNISSTPQTQGTWEIQGPLYSLISTYTTLKNIDSNEDQYIEVGLNSGQSGILYLTYKIENGVIELTESYIREKDIGGQMSIDNNIYTLDIPLGQVSYYYEIAPEGGLGTGQLNTNLYSVGTLINITIV